MSSNEDNIISEVVNRCLAARRLDLSIGHGLLWYVSCDASHDYYRGRVDQRHVESQILPAAVDNLSRIRELEKDRPKGKQPGNVSREEAEGSSAAPL
ncbi:MAG: hypothetical protein SWK76_12305 [Actinomycetota bacterium]|nr:hypothetical protein [Actinomycetota bacterium]